MRTLIAINFDSTHQFRRADGVGVEGSVNVVMTIYAPDMTGPPPAHRNMEQNPFHYNTRLLYLYD